MASKGNRTTTYSLDWDVVVNLELRLLRDFRSNPNLDTTIDLLMVSIGSRLGLRVFDILSLKFVDLKHLEVGERFIVVEKKTRKERVLIMGSRLREVLDLVFLTCQIREEDYIFTSRKGKGKSPMSQQHFNRRLRAVMERHKVRFVGNCSSHLLRKSWVVATIKRGFEQGDHLALIKVSRLIGHSNVSTTLKYTNFELSQSYGLFELS